MKNTTLFCNGAIWKMDRITVAENVEVKGISYQNPKLIAKFMGGSNKRLKIHWDFDNEWDSNAIQVNGKWIDVDGQRHEGKLGYVPKELSEEIVKIYGDEIPLRARLKNIIDPGYPDPKILFDIETENLLP